MKKIVTFMNAFKKVILAVLITVLPNANCLAQGTRENSKKWLIELSTSDIGTIRTIMNFDFQDETFTAATRKNADRAILGFSKASLGRLFTRSFKNGSLLHIINGTYKIRNDSTILSGIFTSAMGNYYFNGTIVNRELNAELADRSKEVIGTIKGTTSIPDLPLENYSAIFKEAVTTASDKLFNPQILKSKEWKKFNKKMASVSSRVQDDLEMVFAFFYYSRKLPFSHFALMKIPEMMVSERTDEYEPQVTLREESNNTAYMKILSFGGTAAEMDSIMTVIKTKDYQNLIVDLRDNSGGSVAAGLAFATNIVDTTFYGGIFLTQKWFNEHNEIPEIEEYDQLPLFSEANFELIIEGIHNEKGLCLKVIPNETVYSGKLFVLVNGNTASTCEPIVYGLRQFNQALIVGEKTAGAMLNGEIFQLTSGFSLIVPTATYYTSDGYKIDGQGVMPDIPVASDDALTYVLTHLIEEN